MNTLDRMIPERMSFSSPDSSMHHSRLIDAFVDDTSLGFSDAGFLTLETMVAKLNKMAQLWENLLSLSGGALNLSKCSWYVMHWSWKHGRPETREILETDPNLSLSTQASASETIDIKRLPLTKATRILGVHLAPDGNFAQQLIVLKNKADEVSIRLRSPKLTPQDIITFHRTMYSPAMRYVLPTMAVDEEELAPVQTNILASMLQKLGYSSKLPTAIRHGPRELGGLDLLDLRTELGISNLKYMRDAVYKGTKAGKLILLNAKYSQIEAGVSEALLEFPHLRIPYLTPSWLMSVCQFLYQHNLTISLTDTLTVVLRGTHDKCIMCLKALTRYALKQQRDINLVRLHLQVITLSDMTTADGYDICSHNLAGERRPGKKIRTKTWPIQQAPTPQQKRLWKRYISSHYLRYGTKWTTRMTSGTPDLKESPPTIATHYTDLQSHIQSLPRWFRRLPSEYTQDATDIEVWRAFRSKRRLIIASDGSLLPHAGTFGWKITTDKFLNLFHGSGPIDGPIELGSSTRSELGGFTAPLLLVTILARHWGLKHRCKFKWIADSRIALHRVTIVTRKDYAPPRQPDNVDYVSVIQDLFMELRRPMQIQWIKAHQDSDTPYNMLHPEAKLNVDCDHLATKQHDNRKSIPMRDTPHLPSTKMSITIHKTRYHGNLDANLRYHINGGYLRGYLQHLNSWSHSVWNTIDFCAFGRNLKRIPLAHTPAHLKCVHNQLPLGIRKFQLSTVNDPTLRLCPCCRLADEDRLHFLQCQHNPSRISALSELSKTLLSDSHPSRPPLVSCIEQHLHDPNILPSFENQKFPQHMIPLLEKALSEQAQIGWHHFLLGYVSKQWTPLFSADPYNQLVSTTAAGTHRTQQLLQALHIFTRSLWLGRNGVLHKDKDAVDSKVYSVESAELRHYHANPTLLPRSDQHYCNIPLQRLLQSRPSVRRRWLRRVRHAQACFTKD